MYQNKYLVTIGLTILVIIFTSCSSDDTKDPVQPDLAINSCEGCHTNYDVLKEIASPDTVVESGGCGGDAPHIEPYDRVYLGGDGYEEFAMSTHADLPCTSCHNGVDKTDDKKVAHSGNFRKYPSDYATETCRCHEDVLFKATNSLHEQGWGQKKRVAMRYGVNSFDDLPEDLKAGYDKNCAKCHGGCGDCHVNRPSAGGG